MRRSVLLSLLAACVFSPSILASPTGLVGERAGRSGFDADALAARGEDTSGTTSTSSDSGSGSLSSALANVSTLPPACSIECQTQVMPVSATTNPKLSDMCDHSAANPKATALQACVLANCTVIEALQAQRFVAELCQVPEVNKAALVMGAIWGFEAFGILGMILRLLAYFVIDGRKFGWDDLVAILILAANVAAGVLVTIATIGYKYGQNIWMLTPNDITNCLKYMITVTPLYIFSTGCLKLALILFYLRIFDKNSGNRYFRILCWFMFAVTVTYTTVHIFTSIFNCWPVQYAWEAWDGLHQGTCGDRSRDGYSHAITNVIVDGILFLLPIPKLWGLNMSWKKKVLVIFMFAFGLFTCVCSIVRVLFMGSNALIGGANGTVTTVPFIIWTIAECKFGLFCACIPMAFQTASVLLKRTVESIKSTRRSASRTITGSVSDAMEMRDGTPSAAGARNTIGGGGPGGGRRGRGGQNPHSMHLEWIDDDDMMMADDVVSVVVGEKGGHGIVADDSCSHDDMDYHGRTFEEAESQRGLRPRRHRDDDYEIEDGYFGRRHNQHRRLSSNGTGSTTVASTGKTSGPDF